MFLRAVTLLVPLTMITGCTTAIDAGSARPGPRGSATGYGGADQTVGGTFEPYRAGATAITYDPAVVPAGARAQVVVTGTTKGVQVRLTAIGMVPRHRYGAHLHTQPCGPLPAEAGPHYQHAHDPAAAASPPSVDPAYANPRNEVWLDFVADANGAASAVSEQQWTFPAGASARSLIVHEQPTRTAPGEAGTAGARVACLTLATR
jgi:Cu-Zn family superoxide dismutase